MDGALGNQVTHHHDLVTKNEAYGRFRVSWAFWHGREERLDWRERTSPGHLLEVDRQWGV